MIIECPACATRYEVPDAAIGSEGRKVRCAKCRHSWQAFAIEDDEPLEPGLVEPAEEAVQESGSSLIDTDRQETPFAGEPATDQADRAEAEFRRSTADPVSSASSTSPELPPLPPATFAIEAPAPPVRRRGFWLWAVVILLVMIGAALAAMFLWGRPAWVPEGSVAFADEVPTHLVLDFPRDQQGPRQLPNGTEIFGARGTVTNAGQTARRVPEILITLRDSHQRAVYTWEVSPPKRSLAPGETVAINEAVTDAPHSAQFAEIGWKPG